MRTAYLEGRSITALARDHRVSRGAIRTAVADLLPDHTTTEDDAPPPELPVTLDMPGKVANFLRAAELDDIERAALDQRVTVRRGQGYTLRVSAVPSVHRQLLARCQPLDRARDVPAIPAQRKARREYENRVSTLTSLTMIVLTANHCTDVPTAATLSGGGYGPLTRRPRRRPGVWRPPAGCCGSWTRRTGPRTGSTSSPAARPTGWTRTSRIYDITALLALPPDARERAWSSSSSRTRTASGERRGWQASRMRRR
ncbi:hypothetical protein ACFXAZ_37010 [Streptomyces sp. NPDC059477]|uniref:hypothetical protein n=1 Tax=Streptomyces sp. NPDC059477 TaxID=3346847 RepID=UPI00367C0D7E